MWRFLVARASLLVVLVLAASSAMVAVTSLAPGDVTAETRSRADPRAGARESVRLGLDRPALARFGVWIGRTLRLDFGTSFRYGQPVASLVTARAVHSLLLAGAALLVAVAIGVPAGLLSGSGRFPRLAGVVGAISLSCCSRCRRCSSRSC